MATPVFCCGFECGVDTHTGSDTDAHVRVDSGRVTFDTTTFRTGARSLRANASAQTFSDYLMIGNGSTGELVGRVYIRFATLPSADWRVLWIPQTGCIKFKQSDSKIYAAINDGGANEGTDTLGSSGVSVTTNTWYRIDFKFHAGTGNETCDVQVDGTACGQASVETGASASFTSPLQIGFSIANQTVDIYYDDYIISSASADYPIGAGYVKSYIPNADGTHNVAGANDFERTLTGTDITNATTTAYQLIDDRPLESAAGDFINGVAPPNSTDYVEWQYEDSSESVAPRAVEAIVGYHDAGGAGTNNRTVTLREHDGGTTANILSGTSNVGAVMSWARAHFATVPGTSDAWTTTKFNALRSRFLVSDHSPDPYIDGAMLEAEFTEVVETPEQKFWFRTMHVPGMRYPVRGLHIGRTW